MNVLSKLMSTVTISCLHVYYVTVLKVNYLLVHRIGFFVDYWIYAAVNCSDYGY